MTAVLLFTLCVYYDKITSEAILIQLPAPEAGAENSGCRRTLPQSVNPGEKK
jgi:hypothetical protein